MGRLVKEFLSRQRIILAGFIWGVTALLVSGMLTVRGAVPGVDIADDAALDAMFHYRVSSFLYAIVAVLIFVFLGYRYLLQAHPSRIRSAFQTLTINALLAISIAFGWVFVIGYLKEVVDALNGRFADVNDLAANLHGLIESATLAAMLTLPPFAVAAFCLEAVRSRLAHWFMDDAANNTMAGAVRLQAQMQTVQQAGQETAWGVDKLEKEIRLLEHQLATIPPALYGNAEAKALFQSLSQKQRELDTAQIRLRTLASENEKLRRRLADLRAEAMRSQTSGGAIVLDEIFALQEEFHRSNQEQVLAQARISHASERMAQALRELKGDSPETPEADAPQPLVDVVALRDERDTLRVRVGDLEDVRDELQTQLKHERNESAVLRHKIAVMPPPETVQPPPPPTSAISVAESLPRKHILVVDDDKWIRNLCRAILEGAGFDVTLAEGVQQAIERLQELTFIPDLILLDIKMPNISGTKFCAALQQAGKLNNVPVVFCSGSPPEEVENIPGLVYRDFIQKPFKPAELIHTIERIVQQPVG